MANKAKSKQIQDISKESSLTQEEISSIVNEFMQEFFQFVHRVSSFHRDFLQKWGFIDPNIDYYKLRVFLDTAANDLKALDPSIFSGVVVKLQTDVKALYDYFIKFKKDVQVSKVVYIRDFLENIKPYRDLQKLFKETDAKKSKYKSIMDSTDNQLQSMKEPKSEVELKRMKAIKRRYVDALHHYSEADKELVDIRGRIKHLEVIFQDEFYLQFGKYKGYFTKELIKIINVKAFYFDKLLWYNAKNSEIIRKFFKDSKIEGDYETKTFIKYYIRNLNIDQTREHDWHSYLTECLRVIE